MVAGEAAKRTALRDVIPGCVRRAVKFLEQNYDITYMRAIERKTLSARTVSLPISKYKKLILVRRVITTNGDETYKKLPRVTPERVEFTETDKTPQGYYQWGNLVTFDSFASTVPEDFDFFLVKFTDFDCLKPTDEHPLIDQFEGALLSRTMLELAPYAREPDWLQTYGSVWETHQKTLTIAQDEFDYSGDTSQWVMGTGYEA